MNQSKDIYIQFYVLFVQNQFQEIEKTRLTLEQQKQQERMAIDNKLKTAAQTRDENIKKMLDRLKEHVSAMHEILIFIWHRQNYSYFVGRNSCVDRFF